MKYLISVIVLVIGMTVISQASTRSDVKVLEASENIKYLVQEMAKDYMLLYTNTNNQNRKNAYTKIASKIEEIEKNIRIIAFATKNPKIKRILDFFAYEKEYLKSNIEKDPNRIRVSKILDSSDAITEGAEKIALLTQYNSSFEEKMFMTMKRIVFLIEKISKYYIVLGSNIDKVTIVERMNQSIKELDGEFEKIKQYNYPDTFNPRKKDLFDLWHFSKKYYQEISVLKIPSIVLLSGKGIENIVNDIAIYHSKNQ